MCANEMMVGIDARKYFDFGIGTYIRNLIREYAAQKPSMDFFLFVAPEDAKTIIIPNGWKSTVVKYGKYSLSEMFLLGQTVQANNVSVFHSPHYTLPFGLASRSVVTIHDLIHIRFPQYFDPLKRSYAHAMFFHAVKKATQILVDSEFTKLDILKSFRVEEKKIEVIHLGVGSEFKPLKSPKKIDEFRKRFQLDGPFILFVGNAMPHKGLDQLLRAFSLLRNKDMILVVAGGRLGDDGSLAGLIKALGIGDRIKELGRITTGDLVLAYNAAELLVLPSLYEGFGFPAIEAMACRTPVVASNGGALPEIVADAALIFERGNAGELKDSIEQVLGNSRLRKSLISKGSENIRRFSWKETARKTLKVYERLM